VVRLQRAADGAQDDFYSRALASNADSAQLQALACTELRNAAGSNLAAWAAPPGAAAGVAVWYDQSGRGNHAAMNSAAVQPQLATAAWPAAVDFRTGRFLRLPDGTLPTNNAAYTVSLKHGALARSNDVGFLGSGDYTVPQASLAVKLNSVSAYVASWASNAASDYGSAGSAYSAAVLPQTVTLRYAGSNPTTTSTFVNGLNATVAVPPTEGVTQGMLDKISASARAALNGAYSIARLTVAYTGPTIKLSRSTDSAVLDFYADVNGTTLTSAGGESLATWGAGATAYVETWYDQSGGGRHATASGGQRPRVPVSGTLLVDLTTAATYLTLPNSTVPAGNAAFTMMARHGVINNADGVLIGSGNDGATNQADRKSVV
jgi:hypothetical protein